MCVHLHVEPFWENKVPKCSLDVDSLTITELRGGENEARSLPEVRSRTLNAWLPGPVISIECSSSSDEKYLNLTRQNNSSDGFQRMWS